MRLTRRKIGSSCNGIVRAGAVLVTYAGLTCDYGSSGTNPGLDSTEHKRGSDGLNVVLRILHHDRLARRLYVAKLNHLLAIEGNRPIRADA